MRISVLGSWEEGHADWPMRGTYEGFKEACRELARAFVKYRHQIIVGGEGEHTVDYHVVQSMIEEARQTAVSRPLIRVLRSTKNPNAFEEVSKSYPSLFQFDLHSDKKWSATQLVSLADTDAVLTIAGKRGTFEAGLAAILAKKIVIPIGSFGGASVKLLAEVHKSVSEKRKLQLLDLNGPWSSISIQQVLKFANMTGSPRLLIIHGHSRDYLDLTNWLGTIGIRDPIVMKDHFGNGKTLPEKFEELAADVDKAIAVATPDDLGGTANASKSKFLARARQNVWLEFGWFWGRLGRGNVMMLSRGTIDLPSDLTGLEYYSYRKTPQEQTENIRRFLGIQLGNNAAAG